MFDDVDKVQRSKEEILKQAGNEKMIEATKSQCVNSYIELSRE